MRRRDENLHEKWRLDVRRDCPDLVMLAHSSTAGPLPKFDGINLPMPSQSTGTNPPAPLQPQSSGGGPIRVPPLTPDKVSEYSGLFEKSGAQGGILTGMGVEPFIYHNGF